MGLLDSVAGALGGQGEGNALMTTVMALVNDPNSGGLAGLLEKFKASALGHLADSWVGTGENLPITADQVSKVLGSGLIQQLAAKAGLSTDALSGQLAQLLPQVIDKLTPNGSLPEASSLQQGLGGVMKGLLG